MDNGISWKLTEEAILLPWLSVQKILIPPLLKVEFALGLFFDENPQWKYIHISFYYYSICSSSDKKTDAGLNRRDLSGRPFGAVFNLHKDYSKIFVGGYPFDAGVQRTMQSTNMNGQIESLKIGKEVQIVYNRLFLVNCYLLHGNM
jgi:hypothetical protein